MTRPEPQPASSTTSSPCSSQPLELLARPRQLGVRDAVVGRRIPVARSPRRSRRCHGHSASSPGPAARGRARRRRSPRSCSSVSAMSSSPSSSRCLISGSISNVAVPPGHRTSWAARSTCASPASAIDAHVLGGQHDRQQPDLRAVGAEDVGEARRDDRLEAVVLERPRRVLAARAAAEVAPGDEDRVLRQLPARLLGPVVEQELAEARSARPA